MKGFKYLDKLIHSGAKEIVLDSDIKIADEELKEYSKGIELDLDDIIINGNGHSIDGCKKARIFISTGKNIQIKNITLKGGYGGYGGAIHNNGIMEINKSSLIDNSAGYGGAIYNKNGEMIIRDSELKQNMAKSNGGAIFNYKGEMTIENSRLNQNSGKQGGAIHNYRAILTVKKSSLSNNISKDLGGAIFNDGNQMKIIESSISQNKSNHGGGLYNNIGEINIIESRLNQNEANIGGAIHNWISINIIDSEIRDNIAQEHGGAIHNFDGEMKIERTEISSNSSIKGNGIFTNNNKIELNSCKIEDEIYEIASINSRN